MNGYEQVASGLVGYIGAALKRDESVVIACIDHFHILAVVLHKLPQFLCDGEIDVLLAGYDA